ncbi:hypothetical protein [Streptomonospora alba]|uniref:hypothetical protein n=1 Tax=Streptomonospora alba TaxID=183763 RepID=UPI0012EEA53F|nr:hypothetical protein [Streptomonospora alba]
MHTEFRQEPELADHGGTVTLLSGAIGKFDPEPCSDDRRGGRRGFRLGCGLGPRVSGNPAFRLFAGSAVSARPEEQDGRLQLDSVAKHQFSADGQGVGDGLDFAHLQPVEFDMGADQRECEVPCDNPDRGACDSGEVECGARVYFAQGMLDRADRDTHSVSSAG